MRAARVQRFVRLRSCDWTRLEEGSAMNFVKFLDDPATFAPSFAEVEKAATMSPQLEMCISQWRNGKCTLEQSLFAAVVVFAIDVAPSYFQRNANNRRDTTTDNQAASGQVLPQKSRSAEPECEAATPG